MTSISAAVAGRSSEPMAYWRRGVAPMYAFGAGTLFPALASLVSRATDEHSQGSVLGGSQVVGGSGRVIGPLWGGFLFQQVGIRSPFFFGAAVTAAALILAARIQRPVGRKAVPEAEPSVEVDPVRGDD